MSNACIGIDAGTFTLVRSSRSVEDPAAIKYRKEINAFMKISLENPFTYKMLESAGVKMVKKDNFAYALGEKALSLAYSFKSEIKRPMRDGCLNNNEPEAYSILATMLHGLIGKVEQDGTIVYYSVPGPAVNKKADVDFHAKMLDQIFRKYQNNGFAIKPFSCNEALAIIFAELSEKAFTGAALSCGGGQVNFCYAVYSQPAAMFSSVDSGDWIDSQAAAASGESIAVINKEKMKTDLTKAPQGMVERAIHGQYSIYIDKTIMNIKKALQSAEYKIKVEDPIDFVIAGGTSSPNGFENMFEEALKKADLPIPIGSCVKPVEPLYTVAKGLLIAAENSQV